MLKMLHTSDWHLGKVIYGMSLLKEQENFVLGTFFDIIQKEKPDVIVIAGDVFDRQVASVDAIKLFDEFLTLASEKYSIPIIVITGNHDSKDRIALAKSVLKAQNIHICTEIKDVFNFIDLKDKERIIRIHPFAYFDLPAAKSYLGKDDLTYADAYSKIIKKINKNTKSADKNILISHCFVASTTDSADFDEIFVGNTAAISYLNFKNFDYVALGHIHSAQTIKNTAHYCGAPLKVSFDEPEKPKSVTVIEVCDNVKIRNIFIKPLHEMKSLRGSFKDIVEIGKKAPNDDYMLIELEDCNPIFMPVEQLRVYYKNILSVQYSSILKLKINQNDGVKKNTLGSNFIDENYVLNEFLKNICGIDSCGEFNKIFKNACELIKEESQ